MYSAEVTSWWSRPCGGRDVLRIALPLVISTATWTVMNFIDRMFLLKHSLPEMAAVLPAGMLHFALVCFPQGIALYVNTFVAQYHGANRPDRIGPAVWQGVWIGVACVPIFLATIPLAPLVFGCSGHEPEMARLETIFYQSVALGAGGEVIAAALAAFFIGRGKTHVAMIVDTLSAILTGILDYLLIFGKCGFPELGIMGAGFATVLALWFRVIAYAALMMQAKYREKFNLWRGWRLDWRLMRRLLYYGGPNGLQLFLEVFAFTLYLLVMGRLGEIDMAATILAFNINSLAFVPMLGLGQGLSTIVGHQLGQLRPNLAARASWTAFWMALVYMGAMAAVYVFAPDAILFIHSMVVKPERFTALHDLTVVLLRFVALYSLFDAMNIIFVSTLKGAGDTRFIVLISACMSPPPVVAVWVGIRYFNAGLIWCWIVITIWIILLGLIYLARFLQGHWRTMRVIEPDVVREEEASSLPSIAV
jgi:multidrug resistance protein, MATE family